MMRVSVRTTQIKGHSKWASYLVRQTIEIPDL